MFYGVNVPLRLFIDDQGGVARPTWKATLRRNPKDALFYKCAKNSLQALLDLKTIKEDDFLNSTRGGLSDHGPTMWFVDVGKVWACPGVRTRSLLHMVDWASVMTLRQMLVYAWVNIQAAPLLWLRISKFCSQVFRSSVYPCTFLWLIA